MVDELRISGRVSIPLRELHFQASRSSGPGGQSVNTSDTKVELTFDLIKTEAMSPFLKERAIERLGKRVRDGVITIVSSEHRSQLMNKQAAQKRLQTLLADAISPPAPSRRPTKPSKSAQRKRVDEKTQRGQTKKLRRPPKNDD